VHKIKHATYMTHCGCDMWNCQKVNWCFFRLWITYYLRFT